MDLCTIDCFAITIHYPGSGHFRYCELIGYSFIWLYDADVGLIEHCKFVNTSESIFIAGCDRIEHRKSRSIHFTKDWYKFVVVDNKYPNSWDKKESVSNLQNDDDTIVSNSNSSLSNEHNIIADKAKAMSQLVQRMVSSDNLSNIQSSLDDYELNYVDINNNNSNNNISNNDDDRQECSNNEGNAACSTSESTNMECNLQSTNVGESSNMQHGTARSIQADEGGNDSDAIYQNFSLINCQDQGSHLGDDAGSENDRHLYDMHYLDVDVSDLAEILSHEYLESPSDHFDDNTSITDVLNASSKSLNQLLAKHTKPPQPKSKEFIEENLSETKAVIVRNCSFINCGVVISMRSHATVTVVNNMMSSISCGISCVGESNLYMIDNFITDCHRSGVYIREKSTGKYILTTLLSLM